MHDANFAHSGEYERFETTSYFSYTGVETGPFAICELMNSGPTEIEATSLMIYNMDVFFTGGYCYNENEGQEDYDLSEAMNVEHIDISFSPIEAYSPSPGTWEAYATAYAAKRYWVNYTPLVSGEKTRVTVDVNCPNTDLQVELSRDVDLWHTTGLAVKDAEAIHNVKTILNAHCSGYETTLTVGCEKIIQGKEKFCTIDVANEIPACWEGNFFKGDYAVVHKTGSFVTSGDNHIVGTGILKVDRLT